MSSEPDDRWRDAQGAHIPVGCRVKQVEVTAGWGARRSRLYQRGTVIGRRRTRLLVRFDGELAWVSLRPHLVRVLAEDADDRLLPAIGYVIEQLERLRARLPAPTEGRPPVAHPGTAPIGSHDRALASDV
ncbi:MAG: hypothetical protein JO281_09060 [Pseudonocardiales bacterium]|nr:hypothetical protein [Pseudonocardiales bacterium]